MGENRVYHYRCRACGMTHLIRMTTEQAAKLSVCPSMVYDILPQLQGCYKTMIHRGTCPTCEGERTVQPI